MKTALAAMLVALALVATAGAGVAPRVLYVHNGRAIVAGLDGTDPTDLSAEVGDADFAVWSPDGREIAVLTQAGFFVLAADGTGARFVAPYDSSPASEPAWSPDGSRLAYIAEGRVWTVPVAAGLPAALTRGTAFEGTLSWSPDGSQLLVSDPRQQREIYSVAYPGGAVAELAAGDQAVWSPRGDRIAYRALSQVAVMAKDGTGQHDETATTSEHPLWLNEDTVVFTSYDRVRPVDRFDNGVRSNIYAAPADGSAAPMRLTGPFDERDDTAGDHVEPVPSPDGTEIEFTGFPTKPWRVNADGTCPEPISTEQEAGTYFHWAWQPGSAPGRLFCATLWTRLRGAPARIAVGRPSLLNVTVENHGNETAHGVSVRAAALTSGTKVACVDCSLNAIPAGASRTVSVAVTSSRWQKIRVRFRVVAKGDVTELNTAEVRIDAVPLRRR